MDNNNNKKRLIYEQTVKALSEMIINYTINIKKYKNIMEKNKNIKFVLRGGDALNYYFNEFTPTHDFDLGLVTINLENNLSQDDYNLRIDIVDSVSKIFINNLNLFFRYFINDDKFKYLDFSENWSNNERLKSIYFRYLYNDRTYTASIIDFYIFGNVDENVINKINGKRVINFSGWKKKIEDNDTLSISEILNSIEDVQPTINIHSFTDTSEDINLKKYLIFNKIDTIIKDNTSNMYYMAPGDLFSDTMGMIYRSIYNIDVFHNKLDKYLKKMSKLINLFNTLNICINNTCKFDINLNILSCDTNKFDCDRLPIENVYKWKISFLNKLIKDKIITDKNIDSGFNLLIKFIGYLSIKKMCEIKNMLEIYKNIFQYETTLISPVVELNYVSDIDIDISLVDTSNENPMDVDI